MSIDAIVRDERFHVVLKIRDYNHEERLVISYFCLN